MVWFGQDDFPLMVFGVVVKYFVSMVLCFVLGVSILPWKDG